MKKMKTSIKVLIFSLVVFTFAICINTQIVNAAEPHQFNICYYNNEYSVTYYGNIVSIDEIVNLMNSGNTGFIKDGYMPGHIGDDNYKVIVSNLQRFCDGGLRSGTYKSCPSTKVNYNNKSTLIDEAIRAIYAPSGKVNTSKIKSKFNVETERFNIDVLIESSLKGKVALKYYVMNSSNKNNGLFEPDPSSYDEITATSDGNSFHINGISPNAGINLMFYEVSDDVCNGKLVMSIPLFLPSADGQKIKNPAKTNRKAYGCDIVDAFYPRTNMTTAEKELFDTRKRDIVESCYNDFILYEEKGELKNNVTFEFNSLKELFKNTINIQNKDTSICEHPLEKVNDSAFYKKNSYWAINCSETYVASGSKPVLVDAGTGFEYQTYFEVERVCNITNRRKPSKKEECHTSYDCSCTWEYPGGRVVEGTKDAGPNNDFDICVNQCDNGKYTQSCINSCYKEVYGTKRDISFTEKLTLDSTKKSNIKFTSVPVPSCNRTEDCEAGESCYYVSDGAPDGSGIVGEGGHRTSKGNPATQYTWGDASCSVSDNYCRGRYGCTFCKTVGPQGCVCCPCTDYANQVNSSESNLRDLQGYMSSDIYEGDYTYDITDSYLKIGEKAFHFIVNTTDNPALSKSSEVIKNEAPNVDTTIGGDCGLSTTVSGPMHSEKRIRVTVKLPLSYINKLTAVPTYRTNTNSAGYELDPSKKESERVVNNFNTDYYYYKDGERKYYTSIYSPNINVIVTNDDITLVGETAAEYNIVVSSSNVGQVVGKDKLEGDGFSSKINCYYGTYNELIKKCKDCPDPDPGVPGGGIQYIFRPIDLTDVFPNGRDPRFNWSCRANLKSGYWQNVYGGGQTVSPVRYTRIMENDAQQGIDIYDLSRGEIEYNFILDKKTIEGINKYNNEIANGGYDFNGDGYSNYLDFDMECSNKNKRGVFCYSRFLDGQSSITGIDLSFMSAAYGDAVDPKTGKSTYTFSVQGRESSVGCNNTKNFGQDCDIMPLDKNDMCRNSYGSKNGDDDCKYEEVKIQ